MVNTAMIFRITVLMFLMMTPVRAESTILCVGDSITEGAESFEVYRYPLYKKLKEAGFHFKFIGSKESTHDGVKLKHNGYGGKNTQFLNSNIEAIYKENPADFILLHSGHNSFAKDHPVKGIISATQGIISKIQRINPKAVIIVAQVITSGKLPKYSYIPDLNKEIKKLALEPTVMTVDMASGFNWETDTIGDKVHPNKNGAEKMALKWFEALSSFKERF